MPQQAGQRDASVPGPIAKVWRKLQLNELIRAAETQLDISYSGDSISAGMSTACRQQ